jgi:hypothetical protein
VAALAGTGARCKRYRRHRQNDFGSDLPVLPDAKPIDDHQERPRCSVLPRIRGFGDVARQPDNLELRIVRLEHDRTGAADIM